MWWWLQDGHRVCHHDCPRQRAPGPDVSYVRQVHPVPGEPRGACQCNRILLRRRPTGGDRKQLVDYDPRHHGAPDETDRSCPIPGRVHRLPKRSADGWIRRRQRCGRFQQRRVHELPQLPGGARRDAANDADHYSRGDSPNGWLPRWRRWLRGCFGRGVEHSGRQGGPAGVRQPSARPHRFDLHHDRRCRVTR